MKTEEMYQLYQKGYSLENIGKAYGITRQSVYSRFKKEKLKLKSLKKKPFIIVDDLKFTINKDGYYECTTNDRLMLHNHNWEKNKGKIPKGYELHHKDLVKINNEVDNLKLVTPKEHTTIHAKLINGSGMNRKVRCIESGEVFDSIVQVAKKHNQHASNVSRYYIDGNRKLEGSTYEKI
jgi:predicted DNA-binding protein YlxM (UPF0122 family)